jgi:hypothetical protein
MSIVKTEAGQQVMKDRSVPLTPRQRSAFILFDGKKSVDDVLKATAAMGVTSADIEHLLTLGLLAHSPGARPAAKPAEPAAPAVPVGADLGAAATPQERYAAAYPLAIKLTSGLGLRGFRLNLAVEGATSYEQLLAVAPKIREAVGPERYLPLARALGA